MNRMFGLRARWIVAPGLAVLAASCGGGGGSSGPPPPPPPSSFGTFSLATNSIAFSTNDVSRTPQPYTVDASATGVTASTLYLRIEFAGPAVGSVTNVRVTGPTTGSATVNPASASQLGIGNHSGTITVYACVSDPSCATQQLAGSPATVNVTYQIAGLIPSANALSYAIGNAPTSAEQTRSFTITGVPAQNWTAGTSVPWLQLARSTGNTTNANTLEAVISSTAIQTFRNGTYPTEITVTPSNGQPFSVPVSLEVLRTQVDVVAPHIAVSNATDRNVIIRGAVFDASAITGVTFGSQAATTFTVLSSTEIRATHPPLAAGHYDVKLQGAASALAALSDATLIVVDPYTFTPERVTRFYAGEPIDILYEPEGQYVYVAIDRDTTIDYIEMFYRVNTTPPGPWQWFQPNGSYYKIYSMAAARNGKTVLYTTENNITSQAVLASQAWPNTTVTDQLGHTYPLGATTDYFRDVAIASDGRALLMGANETSALRPAYLSPGRNGPAMPSPPAPAPPLVPLLVAGNANANLFYDGTVGASIDGSRVLLASSPAAPVGSHLYEYNASTGTLTDTGVALVASDISMDRRGARILVKAGGFAVYSGTLQLLGSLPASALAAVLSPDGTRVYAYDSNQKLRAYDVSGTAVSPLGTAPWSATGSAGDTLRRTVMTISPDGRTLFVAGSDALLIEPIPNPLP
jgi:hypothetical protein